MDHVPSPDTLRAIGKAKRDYEQAHDRLGAAILDARTDGHSWRAIGSALGTTRQGAQRRWGR